jgi:hypothetical protein
MSAEAHATVTDPYTYMYIILSCIKISIHVNIIGIEHSMGGYEKFIPEQ